MCYMSAPYPNGDGAQTAFDRESEYWAEEGSWEDCAPAIMENLIFEAERRELNINFLWDEKINDAWKISACADIVRRL